jgi:hypothetical protein
VRWLGINGLAILAGCAVPMGEVTSVRFADVQYATSVEQSNLTLARDFLDYTFILESGEPLEGLIRYEEPVRIAFGPGFEPYRRDIDALLGRLRREAKVDIEEVADPEAAQLRVEAVRAADMARVFPTAACFIVPGETTWRDFVRRGAEERIRWSDQETLGQAAIFLPTDTTPQDVRDCLAEEITQALGPANDLYRVADSIWNDDNLHGAATPYNMLILRVLYRPELRSGMTRAEVAALLPRLFDRENPPGRAIEPAPRAPESGEWASAIEIALARDAARAERLGAARVATQLAREMQPQDHRLAVSLLALGRLEIRRDPVAAARAFAEAYNLSRRLNGVDDIRTAHAAVHMAAVALAAGEPDVSVRLARIHAPGALAGQNAVLLAGLRSIEAEALLELGRIEEAREARLDSLRWARYGLGDVDGTLAREQAEIAELIGPGPTIPDEP